MHQFGGPYHLVEQNVHRIRVKVVQHVLRSNLLSPRPSVTALKTVSQPERVVEVTRSASLAAAVVAIEVSITSASNVAHGNTIGIEASVDIKAVGRALEQALVLDSPAHDVDLDVFVGEAVIAIEPLEPLLILLVVLASDLGSLGSSHGLLGVPSDTDVEETMNMSVTIPQATEPLDNTPCWP
jgi:hypothetical protein